MTRNDSEALLRQGSLVYCFLNLAMLLNCDLCFKYSTEALI
jgi:hypothetical protein